MKTLQHILLLALVALTACTQLTNSPVETRFIASPQLTAIDSLMWQQPDSALALLQDYFACRDALNASPYDASPLNASPLQTDSIERRNHCVSTTYDEHYAQLLTSELLYKNDYEQTNRAELLQAVAYFDSLLYGADTRGETDTRGESDTRGVSLQGPGRRDASRTSAPNMPIAFLAARAHYINGVGYYERDSVVEACKEYLKALEIMEDRFVEKELVGKKARFMALTYTHLTGPFSDQYLHEQAINFGRLSLTYYQRW